METLSDYNSFEMTLRKFEVEFKIHQLHPVMGFQENHGDIFFLQALRVEVKFKVNYGKWEGQLQVFIWCIQMCADDLNLC